ncbi:MAG: phosphoribosyl-AMP cyclohydrolase [Spirochaetota bacterium]
MASRYSVTKEKVEEIQSKWGAGIVKIGAVFTEKGDYEAVAKEHIDTLYAYDHSPVLFKPTKAVKEQFRSTKDSALSYFVATNGICPEDGGFAIQPWTKVRFENSDVVIHGDTALAMGNYYFTGTDGSETKVEYTFGYLMDKEGNLRINLHHSSIPFQA